MNCRAVVFICTFFIISSVYASTFEFKFGTNIGEVVHSSEGTILPFTFQTTKNIPVPQGMRLSHIRVLVNSLSPPKVDFDSSTQQVTIRFSLTQITLSTYSIVGKAEKVIEFKFVGTSSKSNVLTVFHKEVIPPFVPIHRVKLTSQNLLTKKITHLIVEYISPISKLSIVFDQHESVLIFHIQFPFVPIPFGVVGFSPLSQEEHTPPDQWKNQYDTYKDVIQQFLIANIDN